MFSGKQGAGKTSLAKALQEYLVAAGRPAVIKKFAEPLYWMHDKCLNVLKGCNINHPVTKDGRLLQLLGTEWGRNSIDPEIWVKCMLNRIEGVHKHYTKMGEQVPIVIIDDCRFRNEYQALADLGLTVRLTCARHLRKERAEGWRDDENHQSETDLDLFESEGRFDMLLDTGVLTIQQCVDLIAEELGERMRE